MVVTHPENQNLESTAGLKGSFSYNKSLTSGALSLQGRMLPAM